MDLRQDLAQAIGDLGTYVTLDPDGEARTVYMVCRQNYGGVDAYATSCWRGRTPPAFPGADWGYGLMLAEDARRTCPAPRFDLLDGMGQRWRTEAARMVIDRDENGMPHLVAWRLLLRGTQRATRR
ncbi:MAG: hypothetical protein ACLR7Z_10700 [Bilophila wadsworthia]